MRRLHAAALAWLPLLVFSGCLLPSFKNVEDNSMGGVGGVSGAAGSSGAALIAGSAGLGGEAGDSSVPPAPVDDSFSILQGRTLTLPAPGVLENDAGSSLTVSMADDSDSTRPKKYDAESLSIKEDGSVAFTPAADFFGVYSVVYTVTDKDGATATASVKVHVQPVAAKLAAVRDGIGGFVIDGAAKDGLGVALSGAGDVNHDGIDDLLLGAPTAGASGAGRAYVVYGRAKSSKVALKALPEKSTERTFFDFDGADGDGAGNSVAGIGDLNGDGFSDFAVAAHAAVPSGAVYVLFGGAFSGGYALKGLSSERGAQLTGGANAVIGDLVSHAGDVDGDKIPDLLVSDSLGKGHVYAVRGAQDLASSDIDSVPGVFKIEGSLINEGLPQAFDSVGNVNGDNKSEIAAVSSTTLIMLKGSASGYPAGVGGVSTDGAGNGWRYDVLDSMNKTALAGAGNVDGDDAHLDDLLFCEKQTAGFECRVVFSRSAAFKLDAGWNFTGFSGVPRVAHGADVNGDGYSDLLFGDAATVLVAFGKKSGHADVDVTTLAAHSAGFSLTTEGGDAIDAVATVGDVNGDGIADFAVGDASANNGAGSVYVIFGDKY